MTLDRRLDDDGSHAHANDCNPPTMDLKQATTNLNFVTSYESIKNLYLRHLILFTKAKIIEGMDYMIANHNLIYPF